MVREMPPTELARFKLGLSYTFDDPSHARFGQTVHPRDVLGPAEPDFIFAVIECPDDAAVDPLVQSEAFAGMYGGGNLVNLEALLLQDKADPRYMHHPDAAEGGGGGGSGGAGATKGCEPDARLRVMFHATPHAIVVSEKYQSWMQKFGPNVKHVLMNREVRECARVSACVHV